MATAGKIKRKVRITFRDGTEAERKWEHEHCLQVVTTAHPVLVKNVQVQLQRITPDGWFLYTECGEDFHGD